MIMMELVMKMLITGVDNGNLAHEDDEDGIDDNDDIIGGKCKHNEAYSKDNDDIVGSICKHNEAYSPPLKFAVTGTLLTRGPI